LLGAKPQPPPQKTTVMSRWDVLALSNLQRALYRVTPSVHFEIEEVFLRDRLDEECGVHGNFQHERWYEIVTDPAGPSIVCYGSPRACHAASICVHHVGVTPFGAHDPNAGQHLPFMFVGSPYVGLPSGLAMDEPGAPSMQTHPGAQWTMEVFR